MIRRFPFLALTLCGILVFCFAAACERGEQGGTFAYGDSSVAEPEKEEDGETRETANPFVGSWELTSNIDGSVWYAFFNADGTWRIADNPDGSQQRVYGNYTRNENRLNGDMVNPNVGTGTISAVIEDGMMTLDFTEHWHTPYRTIRYTGEKI